MIAGVLMLGAPAGASAQGVDTTCQFALTRLDATTTNALARHMLPDRSFAQAIQNVPRPGAEAETMGDYYPSGEYLAGPGEFTAKGCGRS